MATRVSGIHPHPRRVGEDAADLPRTPLRWRRRFPRFSVAGGFGLAAIALLALVAASGPWLVSTSPIHQSLANRLAPPLLFGGSASHPLGTDGLGRDLLARVVAGARVTLVIGLSATLISGAVGTILGVAAGYRGGRADAVVTFLSDVQLALPFVVVAIAVVAVLGASLLNVILVLAVTSWVAYARILRLQTMSLRGAAFVEAARASGATEARIVVRHLLPNLSGPLLVVASQQVAAVVLFEAALSFLGLGVGVSTITWGGMVATGKETLASAWWVSVVPGAAIALTVFGFNLFGDWLRDAMDPASRRGNG